jgi:gas vesicle protein
MSDNKILPVSIVSFLGGAFVGAVVALLYAPKSGEELRTQIREEADATVKRATEEWNKAMQDVQQQIEESQAQVKGYMAQLQSQSKSAKPASDETPAE